MVVLLAVFFKVNADDDGHDWDLDFDFSGYSDMAIGLGRFFGFELSENFSYPYASRSVKEFWRKWHITLSTWFRDYVYIPLGGGHGASRAIKARLFLVFLLCGAWHGPTFNFLVWGLWHGLFLSLIEVCFPH